MVGGFTLGLLLVSCLNSGLDLAEEPSPLDSVVLPGQLCTSPRLKLWNGLFVDVEWSIVSKTTI